MTNADTTLTQKQKDFLHWFDQTLLKNKNTKLEIASRMIAVCSATPANIMAYFLGNDFGVMIGNLFDADEETTHFLSGIFGVVAYIPTGILYNMANLGGLAILAALFSQFADLFKMQDRKMARALSTIVAYLLAPFACLPFVYYTMHYLGDKGTPIASLLVFASFSAALNAETNILRKFFSTIETDKVKKIRAPLENSIDAAKKSIQTLGEAQLNSFYQDFRTKMNKSLTDDEILQIVSILLTPIEHDNLNKEMTPEKKPLSKTCHRAILLFSYAMATVAMYTLKPGAMITSQWICDWAHIPEENKENLILTMAALAVMANALFCGFHASNTLTKAGVEVVNKNCPTAPAVAATSFAMAASTMNTVIAVQSGANPWFVGPAFLMPTAMRIMAFIYLVDQCKKLFNQYRYKSPTPAMQRNALIDLLSTLKINLALMNSDYLLSLNSALGILAKSRMTPGTTFCPTDEKATEVVVEMEGKRDLQKTP